MDPVQAPYLFTLLNDRSGTTVLLVGLGVGLAAVLGTVRFLRGWSPKPLIFITLTPTLILSVIAFFNEDLTTIVGLALGLWCCDHRSSDSASCSCTRDRCSLSGR